MIMTGRSFGEISLEKFIREQSDICEALLLLVEQSKITAFFWRERQTDCF